MNITKNYLTPNNYSRSQEKIVKVKGIVIHWVANPNTSALANRNFFESRKDGTKGYGSAHLIVGQVGEIIQCMPFTEVAYHVGSKTYTSQALTRLGDYPNEYTIGIECCHIDWEGNMKDATYNSVVQLTAYLLKTYGLSTSDIWTHQEVVGWKDCHRLFYKNPSLYQKFKDDVAREMFGNVDTSPQTPNGDKNDIYHIMQAGDTLWAISQKYNVTVEQLKALNPNLDVTAIPIGTKVLVKKVENTTSPSTSYDLPIGVFGYGSRGEDVKKIQRALNALNFRVEVVDGIYGNDTRNAVYRYQSMYAKLVTDGVYGNQTREQMLIDLSK
jgi:N-acetylmuramoyl-L-alanine amidase CwlA